MKFTASIAIAITGTVGLVASADLHASGPIASSAALRVDVGPAVTLVGKTRLGDFMCSDRARCSFEVPLNSTFEVSASAPPGHRFEWSGCVRQSAANRCTVEIAANPTHIAVR